MYIDRVTGDSYEQWTFIYGQASNTFLYRELARHILPLYNDYLYAQPLLRPGIQIGLFIIERFILTEFGFNTYVEHCSTDVL